MEKTREVYELPVEEIHIPSDRIRKKFDMKKIRNLAMSFQKIGQKQPAVCRRDGEKIVLIAGERRWRACELIGQPLQFIIDEIDPDAEYEIKKIELEENLCRENLTWLEEVEALRQLHELEQEKFGTAKVGVRGGHGIKDTAEEVQESVGKVTEDLKLAIFAEHSEEVRNAKSKSEAKKIIKRLEEKVDRFDKFEKASAKESEESEGEGDEGGASEENQMVYFGKKILQGKMEDLLPSYEDEYFDVVCFDPPWRVGLDTVRKKGGGTDDFQDDKLESGDFESELETWLSAIYQKMASDSHLYLFFGIVNHTSVYKILEKCGFTTNNIPIIWHKQGNHVTRNPDVWPGRSYEPIAFARKGSKALVRKGASDVILTPAPTPSMKKNHPSAKHPMIYLELLQRSCSPGDKVLDPMCGSGMMGVAAEALEPSLKLDWTMFEKEGDFRRLSIVNVVEGFGSITSRKEPDPEAEPPQEFTEKMEEKTSRGFEVLEPGTAEWKFYWQNHPEEQDAMLQHLTRLKEKEHEPPKVRTN